MKLLEVPASWTQLWPSVPLGVSHGIRSSGDSDCGLMLGRSMPPLGSVGRSSAPEFAHMEYSVALATEWYGGGFHNAKVRVSVPYKN